MSRGEREGEKMLGARNQARGIFFFLTRTRPDGTIEYGNSFKTDMWILFFPSSSFSPPLFLWFSLSCDCYLDNIRITLSELGMNYWEDNL
jgi:hypothetical protein